MLALAASLGLTDMQAQQVGSFAFLIFMAGVMLVAMKRGV